MNFKSIFLLLLVCLLAFFIQSSCVNKPITDKERLTGQFNYKTDPDFIKLPLVYSTKEIYLRKTVFEKFKAMADSAAKVGITLKALCIFL